MKIRTGFVSNSSSSSFIVQCKKDKNTINNIEDLKTTFDDMFGYDEEDWTEEPYVQESYDKYLKFAQDVWNDGDGILFEEIDQNAIGELEDLFDRMGIKCMMGEY